MRIYFLKKSYECDFITVYWFGWISDVIQVCSDLNDPLTLRREVEGINAACKRSGVSHGTIITYDQQDKLAENGITINLVPLPFFLCT